MIYAYHVPLCNYGFWLPNDSRGSGSDYIRNKNLLPYGPPTKVQTRRSVAHRRQNFEIRRLARAALRYPPVEFSGVQALSCGKGIRAAVERHQIVIWACAILPEHMHLVIKRHRYPVEQVIRQLRTAMTDRLIADGTHPLLNFRGDEDVPCCWARSPWKVFLDTKQEFCEAFVT